MKKSVLFVVVIWAYVVSSGIMQGFALPTSELGRHAWPMEWPDIIFFIFLPLLVIIGGAFINKHVPGAILIGRRIDKRFGPGAYLDFMRLLRLELLFSAMSFGIGLVGLARTVHLRGPSLAFVISGFFISGGVAFLAAHFISRWRRLYDTEAT